MRLELQLLALAVMWLGMLFACGAVLSSKGRSMGAGFIIAYLVCAPAALFYAAFSAREVKS